MIKKEIKRIIYQQSLSEARKLRAIIRNLVNCAYKDHNDCAECEVGNICADIVMLYGHIKQLKENMDYEEFEKEMEENNEISV